MPTKLFFSALAVCFLVFTPMSQAEDKKPESLSERVSYAYGLMVAQQLTEKGVEIDFDQFAAGFKGVLNGAEPALSEDEVSTAFEENREALEEAKLAAAKKVLEEYGKKEGVTTTESGLQYEVLKEGDGDKPSSTDKVEVHYHGTLPDGTVFDSSVERGQKISFSAQRSYQRLDRRSPVDAGRSEIPLSHPLRPCLWGTGISTQDWTESAFILRGRTFRYRVEPSVRIKQGYVTDLTLLGYRLNSVRSVVHLP